MLVLLVLTALLGKLDMAYLDQRLPLNLFLFFCILNRMHISSQPVLSTRVNVVFQDCQVHSVQKAKVSLALWSVFEHLLLLFQ